MERINLWTTISEFIFEFVIFNSYFFKLLEVLNLIWGNYKFRIIFIIMLFKMLTIKKFLIISNYNLCVLENISQQFKQKK